MISKLNNILAKPVSMHVDGKTGIREQVSFAWQVWHQLTHNLKELLLFCVVEWYPDSLMNNKWTKYII